MLLYYNAQDSPHNNYLAQNVSSAVVENFYSDFYLKNCISEAT